MNDLLNFTPVFTLILVVLVIAGIGGCLVTLNLTLLDLLEADDRC